MTDRIEPALTPEQWASLRESSEFDIGDPRDSLNYVGVLVLKGKSVLAADAFGDAASPPLPVLVAVANDALLDSAPRKITRAWADDLRKAAHMLQEVSREAIDEAEHAELNGRAFRLGGYAAALESYLPPE